MFKWNVTMTKQINKNEESFTTIRVPVEVKKRAEQLRDKLQQKKEYNWLGTLALGAVLGYALGKILEEEK